MPNRNAVIRKILWAVAMGPLVGAGLSLTPNSRAEAMDIKWSKLPDLPPATGQTKQAGLASPFVGVHQDALIIAGGANFPGEPPWQGGAKAWWRDIYVLEHLSSEHPEWVRDRPFTLPRPMAYGISVSTPEGVVCAGGADAGHCYADVFLLTWDPEGRQLRRTDLPAMPHPLAFMAGALVGTELFVAGGQQSVQAPAASTAFWSLDLGQRGRPGFRWRVRPAWPGPARIVPVAAGLTARSGGRFLLFSGRLPAAGEETLLLNDAYEFDLPAGKWTKLPDVRDRSRVCVMAATAANGGEDEVLVFGGDRGDLFHELEAHDLAIARLREQRTKQAGQAGVETDAAIASHLAAKTRIYEAHPGFAREVLAYNVPARAWRRVGVSPLPLPVTTAAVQIGRYVIIPTGEIRPGVRTPAIIRATLPGRAGD